MAPKPSVLLEQDTIFPPEEDDDVLVELLVVDEEPVEVELEPELELVDVEPLAPFPELLLDVADPPLDELVPAPPAPAPPLFDEQATAKTDAAKATVT